jgi:hypothetical protein
MSSLRRINSSRANAARSPDPITFEGKEHSSANALRHGLLAKCVVLQNESNECFDDLVTQHIQRFAPADGVEFAMIEEMVAANWRMRRAWAIENRLPGATSSCFANPNYQRNPVPFPDSAPRWRRVPAVTFPSTLTSPLPMPYQTARRHPRKSLPCSETTPYQTNPIPFSNTSPLAPGPRLGQTIAFCGLPS